MENCWSWTIKSLGVRVPVRSKNFLSQKLSQEHPFVCRKWMMLPGQSTFQMLTIYIYIYIYIYIMNYLHSSGSELNTNTVEYVSNHSTTLLIGQGMMTHFYQGKSFERGNIVVSRGIWVSRDWDIAQVSDFLTPVTAEEFINTGVRRRPGRVTCRATLERKAFVRRENIKCRLEIENGDSNPILATRYTFADAAGLMHYNDVIIGAMASQIISLAIVYSNVYSGADQRKSGCPAVREKSGKFQTWQKSGKSQGILLKVREKMNIGKSQGICI